MTKSDKDWWEQQRAKGEARFVLREGLVRRGLPFAVIMIAAPLIYDAFTHHPVELSLKQAIKFAFYAVGFGGLVGTGAWRDREKDYNKPTEDDDVA